MEGPVIRYLPLAVQESGSPEEQKRLLRDFNQTSAVYPQNDTIHQLIDRQAHLTPNALAILHNQDSLTYAALNAQANRLARYLEALGVQQGELVGIFLDRGIGMMVGLLATLKTGAAYVPLDPTYPPERLAYMIENAVPRVILAQNHLVSALPLTRTRVVLLDTESELIARESAGELAPRILASSQALAYVIYTSGSTGKPKGVMVEHTGVVNMLCSLNQHIGLSAADRFLTVTTICFDMSVPELYWPLIRGATMVMTPKEVSRDAQLLSRFLDEHAVTVMQATPATWRMLLSAGWSGRSYLKALCGGEAMTADLADQLLLRVGALWNLYGPTETTVWSSLHPVPDPQASRRQVPQGATEPIGRPIANTRVYILDLDLQPVPIGMAGEIYIGGTGVARGYLHRPGLTAERFIADPFNPQSAARLYKTGDRGRWNVQGTLEYLGRNDTQVKLRGFRIELGEIESHLLGCDQVKEAVVIVREDTPGDSRLVAYIVAQDKANAPSPERLHEQLKAVLPDYMLPSFTVILEHLPLTPNGKVDRRSLPPPIQHANLGGCYEAPQGEIEVALSEIWQEILQVKLISRSADFFALGGHSLLGARLIPRVQQRFAVTLPALAVFDYRSLDTMAGLIERLRQSPANTPQKLAPRSLGEPIPLTFSQQAYFEACEVVQYRSVRALSSALRIRGALDLNTLRQTFARIVGRHEALRITIRLVEGVPWQHPDERCFELPVRDLRGLDQPSAECEARRLVEALVNEPIDVTANPLFVAALLKLETQHHVLVLSMDHLIGDAISLELLLRDIWTTYASLSVGKPPALPAIPIQFGDYAVWQRKTDGAWRREHGAYWKERLAGASRVRMFEEQRGAKGAHYKLARLPLALEEGLSAALRDLSRKEQLPLAMIVLTVYVALVLRWCAKTDLVVKLQTSGRLHVEVESTVGFLSSELYLRVALHEGERFHDLLRRVAGQFSTAYLHDDGFRMTTWRPRPPFTRNTTFNWLPPPEELPTSGDLKLESFPFSSPPYDDIETPLDRIPVPFEDCPCDCEPIFLVSDKSPDIAGCLLYWSARLDRSALERFSAGFRFFAAQLAHEPGGLVPFL